MHREEGHVTVEERLEGWTPRIAGSHGKRGEASGGFSLRASRGSQSC